MFVLFAVAALAWSWSAFRWSISRHPRRAGLIVVTSLLGAAAIASALADLRSIRLGRGAPRSALKIRIAREGAWWRLDYERNGVAFTTANEMHVPDGTAVTVEWPDLPPPWIESGVCFEEETHRCTMVTRAPRQTATFAGLWPPRWSRLVIVGDAPNEFERWFRNQATPARRSGQGWLFVSAGCGYCHVVRGVSDSPSWDAPELTHFAARATIGGIGLPNRIGFLSGWVVNSRALKKDSDMPQNQLDPNVLHGLTAYLESLR
jgi:cytochrome c oxidase subunit II